MADVTLQTVGVTLQTVGVTLQTVDVTLQTVDVSLQTVDVSLQTVGKLADGRCKLTNGRWEWSVDSRKPNHRNGLGRLASRVPYPRVPSALVAPRPSPHHSRSITQMSLSVLETTR